MRRLALLAVVALAGCGGGGGKAATKPHPHKPISKHERAEKRKALERIEHSSLPDDAKKDLEEAQDLLDQ